MEDDSRMFNIGDLVKVNDTGHVFRVCGYSAGCVGVPDGWPMSETGSFHNPEFCTKYIGATSCFVDNRRKV